MPGELRGAVFGATLAALMIAAAGGRAAPVAPYSWPDVSVQGQRGGMPLAPGELDAAHAGFERLREANPHSPAPYIGLAEVAAGQGDLAAAEAYLKAGLAANPRAPYLHRALGRVHAAQGQAEAAEADFGEAIRLAPDLSAAWLEMADLLARRRGQPARALPFYDTVLAHDPGNGAAHYGRALALAATGEEARALAEFDEAARLLPDSPVPDYARARLLAQSGRPVEALAALDAAALRQPGFMPARLARAGLLLGMGRRIEAFALYDAVSQQDPGSVAALLGAGLALELEGQLSGAAARYRTALAIDPANAVAMNNLAWVAALERRGLDEALAWAQRAVASAPAEAAFADTLGWVHYQRDEIREAEAALAGAVALGPDAGSLTRLAAARARLGRKGEAEADIERALQIDPDYQPAREELARLREAP